MQNEAHVCIHTPDMHKEDTSTHTHIYTCIFHLAALSHIHMHELKTEGIIRSQKKEQVHERKW